MCEYFQGWRLMNSNLSTTEMSRNRLARDLIVIGALVVVITALSIWFDAFDRIYTFSRHNEYYEIDGLLTFGFVAGIALVIFSWRRVQDQRCEIKARGRAEQRALRLANVDALTGLPNRRRLEADLEDAVITATADEKRAVMILDLNRFKPINDVYGHQIGDDVLVALARRLAEVVDEGTLVARLGGDEFAVLTGPITESGQATRQARRIITSMEEQIEIGAKELTVGVGIGIALAPDDATDSTELMRRAEVALSRAKVERQSAFHFFEVEMDRQTRKRAQLETDLRRALCSGDIRPHFQPIVRLENSSVIGFEALARWTHPERGQINPSDFVAIAEDCGLISLLSSRLLEYACAEAVKWPKSLVLSFNISPSEIGDPVLILRILKILADTGLDPRRLEIELTENALVHDYAAARKTLEALRESGIRIALDDFGAGNSSLRNLRELNFDRLKIDKGFIADMASSDEAATMVKAILHLASALNMTTTAEGIEQFNQIGPLLADGCVEAQGFHFGAALPADQVLAMLDESQKQATN